MVISSGRFERKRNTRIKQEMILTIKHVRKQIRKEKEEIKLKKLNNKKVGTKKIKVWVTFSP